MRALQSFITLFILLVGTAAGAEIVHHTILLKVGSLLAKEICPTPVWNHISILYQETKDERSVPEVGWVEKKKTVTDKVFVESSLSSVFEKNVQKILEHCGVKWVSDTNTADWKVSVLIKDFELVTDKRVFKESTSGIGRVAFQVQHKNGSFNSFEVQYELKYEDAKYKPIRQLERAANDLLVGLLKQIPTQLKTVIP